MSASEEQLKMPGNGISLEPNVATSNEKAAESVEYNIAFEEILKDDKSVSSSSSSDDDDIPQCQKCCPKCCNKHFAGAVECGDCLCGCRIEIRDWYRRTDFKGWFKQKLSWENAKHHFPILAWVPKYKLKYIQGDAIAGITVGLTVLPQGLAYAKLANLPMEYGLYTSFMCCYVYIFLGTAKDMNLGPTAVMSLMTARFAKGEPTYAVVLSLISGCIQFVLALFNLGFIVEFFAHPVVHSFIQGSVITIITSQIPNWFGLEDIPKEFFQSIYHMCAKLPETRYQDFVLGLICMIVLYLMKKMRTLKYWKPEQLAKSRAKRAAMYCIWLLSLLRNALVVVAAMGAVAIFEIYDAYPFSKPDEVPGGLPPFKPPAFSGVNKDNVTYDAGTIFKDIGVGFAIVPLLGLIETVAIAKAFGRLGNYISNPNQELYALGVSNILGSFVSAYPVTGSISRSAVNNQSGCRTTGSGFYTGTLVVLVVAFLTPLFEYIPDAALAAVIIMAVADMADFHFVLELWYKDRLDLFAWVVTFVLGLSFGIEVGLVVGCLVSLCFILFPAARPKLAFQESKYLERMIEDTIDTQEFEIDEGKDDIIVSSDRSRSSDSESSSQTEVGSQYVIVTPNLGLMFPCVEFFKEKMLKFAVNDGDALYRAVIIDFVHVTTIDYSLMQGIQELIEDFIKIINVPLVFCEIQPSVQKCLARAKLKDFHSTKTVDEAVAFVKEEFERRKLEAAAVQENDDAGGVDRSARNGSSSSSSSSSDDITVTIDADDKAAAAAAAGPGTDNYSFQF